MSDGTIGYDAAPSAVVDLALFTSTLDKLGLTSDVLWFAVGAVLFLLLFLLPTDVCYCSCVKSFHRATYMAAKKTPAKPRESSGAILERSLTAVYACVAVDMLGTAFTISIMPFYVRELGGFSPDVGLVISTWAAGYAASLQPTTAAAARR